MVVKAANGVSKMFRHCPDESDHFCLSKMNKHEERFLPLFPLRRAWKALSGMASSPR
jgi:hypothetical protein